MKLNDLMRYPHPVLSPGSDDFVDGSLQCEIVVLEAAESEAVRLSGTTAVTQTAVSKLLERGKAVCGIFVTCLDTYCQEFHETGTGDWAVELSPGAVRGTVQLRPVIAIRDDAEIEQGAVHAEFRAHSLKLRAGDMIAMGEELRFEAGLDKLVPMESVFRLLPNAEITEPRFVLQTDKQAVEIHVSPALFTEIATLRAMPSARNLLLSCLYLPCIVELLSIASDEPKPEHRWYQAISARCNQLGLQLDGRDLSDKAQRLLNNPLGLLHPAIEGLAK